MFIIRLLPAFFACLCLSALSANSHLLISTESDPDAFIQDCVNIINGDYYETVTDLVIAGPDPLVLQRYYSSQANVLGGGWKIFPQRFLVMGKDASKKPCNVGKERFEWTCAFAGERSGGVLPYNGWKSTNGFTKDPLKIDILNQGVGLVNTYAKEINGQTNHQNNQLHCKGDICELTLGDGSKRIYKQVNAWSTLLLGEEEAHLMAAQVTEPVYFLLTQEILPSGNQLSFSYDEKGHLTAVEMQNSSSSKILSWMHFSYEFTEKKCQVSIQTSDSRELIYEFVFSHDNYQLTHAYGLYCIPINYEYKANRLVKKNFPEERFVEITYQDTKVKALKGANAKSGQVETVHTFSYEKDYTDVFDAHGIKTRYRYDKRFQLTAIERYDEQNKIYRIEQKFWGKNKAEAGFLLATTIGDGQGHIHSYRHFQYDKSGNIIEEKLYGNLTGKQNVSLQISPEGKLLNPDEEECHIKTFGYSFDGFNLITKMGDSKGNQTLYTYKPGTNLLIKKFIYDKGVIKRRTFQSYNSEGVCVKIIEDDGSQERETDLYLATERHIQEIQPKETLPGVGLPLVIEKKAVNLKTNQEILLAKFINTYDEQAYLISCDTYDANNQYAFTETRTYNPLGQIVSQTDGIGRKIFYNYDGIGNQISCLIPHKNKQIRTIYDFHNRPIKITETYPEEELYVYNTYDALGRKTSSTNHFGNTTYYEYDAFHRLTKVIHPAVKDESNQHIQPTFSYTYDIFGNVLTITDPKGFVTTKSYNLRGNPTKISYPDGSIELFKYDPEGSLHRSLTRDQIITVYEYDYLGRSTYEESSTSGETGVLSFLRSKTRQYNGFKCIYEKCDDSTKRYTFDFAGRLSSVTEHGSYQNEKSPEARTTEWVYDTLGRIDQKKVWFDIGPQDYSVECLEYDLAGNIIQKRIEDAQGSVLLQRFYTYDLQGQCIEEYFIEGKEKTTLIKTSYNSQGDPIAYVDGSGQETKIIYRTYQNSLDQIALKKTIINPMGTQTEFEFDALGRICAISKKNSFGVLLSSQRILYDSLGNKACEVHDKVVQGKVEGSQEIHWIYGPMSRLEKEIQAAHNLNSQETQYEYNALGKLISKKIVGNSTFLNYTYNKSGNLSQVEAQNNKKELQISNSYSYDRNGNIISAQSLNGKSIQRNYNAFNQVVKEFIKDGEGSYNLEYTYDKKGRLKEITLPDLSKIAYIYDAVFGREVRRISSKGEILYNHTYETYDSQGKLLSQNHIGYIGNHEYEYNLNGQKIASKNDLISEEYVRDPLGRVIEIKSDHLENYTYNDLSQLTSEEKLNTQTYAYDSLDNCIKMNNEELAYNALNQLVSHANIEFSYDPQGNILKKVLDGEEIRFESNILSQLISIEKSNQTALAFSYDPFGRLLVEKHIDTKEKNKRTLSTSRYFYLGYQEIGVLSQTGMIEILKIPGLQGDELAPTSVAFEIQGEVYAPLHDIAGNVTHLIDPYNREIMERYEYSAFGKEVIFNGDGEIEERSPIGNPWRFAEKRMNEKSGLILFGLRFYDPQIGRWISQDPAGFIDGPNLYAYLHNNPTNYLDRFGLNSESSSNSQFEKYFYGEVESHCYCEKHRTCKRGGDIGSTISFTPPKITYVDYFEKYYKDNHHHDSLLKDYYDSSIYYDLSEDGLPNLPNDLGIGFINGVWNDFEGSKANVHYISKLAGGYNVHAVYNATHGYGIDIVECGMGLKYIATEPVKQLHQMWNSFFDKSSTNAKFLMICHSQGAIHVRNALLDYPELRDRILVVAIAPGGYIYQETCANVIHYRAKWWRDFIPRLDSAGASRERHSIVNLSSHPSASAFDHEFMSPTYQERLQRHIRNYIQSQGENL